LTGRCVQGFDGETLREIGHFENLGLDKRVILKWVLKKSFGRAWTELIHLRIS
jgi:hypothetical protein